MATVDQLVAPYTNHLLPLLPAVTGVCSICATPVVGYRRCFQCNRHRQELSHRADAVTSIALAVKGGQLAHELASYKSSPRIEVRARFQLQLAALLWKWIRTHERCLLRAATSTKTDGGAVAFDVVTTVPSLRGRNPHPLRWLVAVTIAATRDRHQDLLAPAGATLDGSTHPLFEAVGAATSKTVLLIDDTWTSGTTAQSAAGALKRAGASHVGILTLGRHVHPDQPAPYGSAAKAYLAVARDLGWSWDSCALCRRTSAAA